MTSEQGCTKVNWKKEIAVAYLVREKVKEADTKGVFKYHLPALAATESDLLEAEKKIGERLSEPYREFLKCANGWRSVLQNIDLFGSENFEFAEELLDTLNDVRLVVECSRNELLPIGVSRLDGDVIAMSRSCSSKSGKVFWLAGQLVDEFPNFQEFFLAMVDYNRANVQEVDKS